MTVDQLREALATMPAHIPVHVAVNSDHENGGGADCANAIRSRQEREVNIEDHEYDALRMERIMQKYHCSHVGAARYLDLRDEGYSRYQAALMAGIRDPDEQDGE